MVRGGLLKDKRNCKQLNFNFSKMWWTLKILLIAIENDCCPWTPVLRTAYLYLPGHNYRQTSILITELPNVLLCELATPSPCYGYFIVFFFGAKTLISNHNLGSIEVKSCALRWDKLNSVCNNVHQIVSDEKLPWQSLINDFEFLLTRVETLKDFVTISPAWYSGGFQSCRHCGEVERRQHLLIECFSQNAPGQSMDARWVDACLEESTCYARVSHCFCGQDM